MKKPWVPVADVLDFNLPCPSIFATSEEIFKQYGIHAVRPLSEKTMRRIARGIEKFVLKNPSPFIIQVNHGGENFRGQDIAEPLDTITAKHGTGVVMPMMIQYHDEQGSEVRGQTIDKPIMTVDASNRYGMVSAFISKFYGTSSPASAADAPLPTVTAIDHNALCAAYVTQFNNNCDGQCADEPLNTITARAGHFGDVRAFLVKYYGHGDNSASCEKPAPTITSKDRLGLVTVRGEKYQIVDIGLRMLTPRELFDAQGFPENYIIDVDVDGKAYPIIEIAPKQGFYDYKNKYQAGSTVETCPAEISPELTEKMQHYAEAGAKALCIEGYARFDFMMKENGDMYCLEANTLPGMTPTSLIPQEAKVLGIDYPDLCEELIRISFKKYSK